MDVRIVRKEDIYSRANALPVVKSNRIVKIVINSQASMFARYEDESEDHQILMTMEYTSF